MKKKVSLVNIFFYLIIISVFLLPYIQINSKFPKIRPEDCFIFASFLLIIKNIKISSKSKLFKYIFLLIAFASWIAITILLNIFNNSFRSIFEILKTFKFILIILISYYIFDKNVEIYRLLDLIFIIIVIFNVMHYFNIFNFNYYMKGFFYALNPFHYENYIKLYELKVPNRLLGTFGNPNQNATLFSFFILYFILIFRENKEKKYLVFLILSIILFLLCNSRTLFISLIISLSIYFFFIQKEIKIKVFFIILIVFLVLVLIKLDNFRYLTSLFTNNLSQNTSLLKRFDIWRNLVPMLKYEKIIYGFGPYKEFFYQNNLVAESEYILIYWRYGLVGISFHLLIMLMPMSLIKYNKYNTHIQLLFLFTIIILISGLTMAPFSNPRFNLLYGFLIGFGFGCIDNEKNIV